MDFKLHFALISLKKPLAIKKKIKKIMKNFENIFWFVLCQDRGALSGSEANFFWFLYFCSIKVLSRKQKKTLLLG